MKYVLLNSTDDQNLSETVREHCYVDSARLAQELRRAVAVSDG
jgi:hypothetical protein